MPIRPKSRFPYLHDLILQSSEEEINNLVLLDWQRVEVDLLHRLYLSSLDQAAELGDWLPFLLLRLSTTAGSTTSTTASTVTTARSESTSARSSVSHFCD